MVNGSHRCSEREYHTWYSSARAIYEGTTPFNAHVLNGPTCLMTRLQVVHLNTVAVGNLGGVNVLGMHLDYMPEDGEACFNSAATLQVYSMVVIGAMMLFILLL